MLENNYKLIFEDKMCKIYDKNRGGRLFTTIKMNKNKLFPHQVWWSKGDVFIV